MPEDPEIIALQEKVGGLVRAFRSLNDNARQIQIEYQRTLDDLFRSKKRIAWLEGYADRKDIELAEIKAIVKKRKKR